MANLDSFRRLIREEVRAVFKEEMAVILKEVVRENRPPVKSIAEDRSYKKSLIPGTLNTAAFRPTAAPNLGKNNPLTNILAETAQAMSTDDYQELSYTSTDAQGFNVGFTQPLRDTPVVDSVTEMVASARGSSNFDAVQINAVPDFTELMGKLRSSGQI